MLIAPFNAGTAWVGKTTALDDGRFTRSDRPANGAGIIRRTSA